MGWIPYVLIVTRLITGHWGHQKTKLYYNGLKHDDIMKENGPIFDGIERGVS